MTLRVGCARQCFACALLDVSRKRVAALAGASSAASKINSTCVALLCVHLASQWLSTSNVWNKTDRRIERVIASGPEAAAHGHGRPRR
eukprot:2501305-Pleurochrysis_carterae.AAC.1